MQTLKSNVEEQQYTASFSLEVKKRSDKLMNYFLIGYFIGGLVLATFYDTWLVAIGVGGLSLIAYYSAKWALPKSNLYQYVLSVVLAIFMAQYIYQMHGLFEMHFTAFIGSAILITYQNWKLQIAIALAVVAHHAAFGYLQNTGLDTIYFTQLESFEIRTFVIHVILAAVIFFVSGLWAYQLKKSREIQVHQTLEMTRLQQEATIAANEQALEEQRHAALLDKAVAQGKFEIASGVMHDIGNAVVGFGSYLTRVRRLQENEQPDNLQYLAHFFEEQNTVMISAVGEAKAGAIVKMLNGIAEAQRTSQEEISKSIAEQLNIITHIQEILNIQRQYVNGYESKDRMPVNIKNVVNDSLSMLFAQIDKAGIQVSLNMPGDLPVIKGDRTKLMQVLLNVLKNSIEAIDKDAREKNIYIDSRVRTGELELQIKDTGKGFGENITQQLFKRGYTTKSSGSGLGLYNCRSIIESHEGEINVNSPGEGKGALTAIRFKI